VSDATSTPPAGEPELSEEQARQYAEQLRSVPAEQVVTEVLSSLLNLAQVKLGRRDARLLIDLCAVLVGHARRHLSSDLSTQVDHALSQLRLAQVQAEGTASGPEPNDLAVTPAPPAGAGEQPTAPPPPPAQPPPQPSPASRLWVPGRDF
jgi:hypothetical protein